MSGVICLIDSLIICSTVYNAIGIEDANFKISKLPRFNHFFA